MPRRADGQEIVDTAREILRYFANHPGAKDTLEGIAKWWLERERIERTVQEVAACLRFLLDRGFIKECRGQAVRPYYELNPRRRSEILEFLRHGEGHAGDPRQGHDGPRGGSGPGRDPAGA